MHFHAFPSGLLATPTTVSKTPRGRCAHRVKRPYCVYTKAFRKIKSDADRQHLQDDLNMLIEWSEKWQMLFNFGKCKCLHTGHGNEDAQYTMGDTVLNTNK